MMCVLSHLNKDYLLTYLMKAKMTLDLHTVNSLQYLTVLIRENGRQFYQLYKAHRQHQFLQ